jgi:LCP family protein required for cell wall assembly
VVIIAFVAGLLAFNAVRGMVAGWSGGSPRPFGRPVQTSSPGDTVAQQTDFPLLPEETPEPWDGTERVTVLLMGLDYRDWQSDDGPPRTDTMLLSTIDPVSRTAGMLSIPRDLWVEIPGFDQHNRINTAYFLGETYNVPGGGPALAMKTVEHFLGVPIEYYAVIEFSAFERFIDEIGGIDVLVKQRVKISPIGEMSKWLEAKPYHLDGAEALAYARARQTEGGDFDRAERQQQVALAIRDRIMGFDMLPRLVSRSPALYQELRAGVRTNLIDTDAPPEQIIQQLKQVIALARLAMEIPLDEIHKGVIAPPDMVTLATLPDGAQVLKPVPDQIRFLRDEIFTTTGAVGPSVEEETSLAAAQKEAAQIAVLNGAGIEGLAGRTAQFLEGEGLQVVEVGNAKRMDYTKSLIIDYTGNPYTRRYFVELLGISESQILSQLNPSSEVDVALILGADWSVP